MNTIYRIHYLSELDPVIVNFNSIENAAKTDNQAEFSFNHMLEHGDTCLTMGQTIYEIVRLH